MPVQWLFIFADEENCGEKDNLILIGITTYLHSRSAWDRVGPGMRCAAMSYSSVARYRLALLSWL